MLRELFYEADPNCFEVSRIFLGGKNLIEFNPDGVFQVDTLSYHFQKFLYVKDFVNYNRNIMRISKRFNIGLKGKKILNIGTYRYGEMEEINGSC